MKKGFTLIELLAVIIILAVIALIATPIVLDVVESAKISSFESTAYGMIDAMKLKSAEDMIDGNSMAKNYTFPSNELDVQGSQLTGTGSVDKDGRIQIAVNNGKWCAIKGFTEGTITIKDYAEGECTLSSEEVATYNVSDYVKIKVGPNAEDVYNFYILSVDGDKITAIMDRNIGDNIAWGNSEDTTPTIAETQITPLKTSWTNASEVRLPFAEELISQTEWYKGLSEKEDWENEANEILGGLFEDNVLVSEILSCMTNECVRNVITNAGHGNILVPTWLDINLNTTGDDSTNGYWTQDRNFAYPGEAWYVDYFGGVLSLAVSNPNLGVRPVIEINNSHIIEKLSQPENNQYSQGQLLEIKVNETNNESHYFYVLKDNGDTITAIMDRNYGEKTIWGNAGDTTPTMANAALPTTWANASEVRLPYGEEIMMHTSWYQNLADKSNWLDAYDIYFLNFIFTDEIYNECSKSNEACRVALAGTEYEDILLPKWLDVNLTSTGASSNMGYWTSAVTDDETPDALVVTNFGVCGVTDITNSTDYKIRPVIEISKEHIINTYDAPKYVESGFIR